MRNLSLDDDSDLRGSVFRLSSTGQGETREPPSEDAGTPPAEEGPPTPNRQDWGSTGFSQIQYPKSEVSIKHHSCSRELGLPLRVSG